MDKEIGKHILGITERMAFLRDNADAIEKKGYMKQFTSDQISDMKDRLAEVSIRLNDIAVAKKEAMDDFKEQAKPFKEEKSELLQQIKERVEYVEEECYKIVGTEEGWVTYYNKYGDAIESRKAKPDEMQTTIFTAKREGTNN